LWHVIIPADASFAVIPAKAGIQGVNGIARIMCDLNISFDVLPSAMMKTLLVGQPPTSGVAEGDTMKKPPKGRLCYSNPGFPLSRE